MAATFDAEGNGCARSDPDAGFTRKRGSLVEAAATTPVGAPRWLLEQLRAANDVAPSTTSTGDWFSVYINLARRRDRQDQLLERISRANPVLASRLQRIDAIDGKALDLDADRERLRRIVSDASLDQAVQAQRAEAYTIVHQEGRLIRFHNHLTSGGVACAMSHRKALEAVATHPTASWGLILEDDISAVVPNVHEAIADILKQLPETWDAVFLGYHGGVLKGTDVESSARSEHEISEAAQEQQRGELELQIDQMRGHSDGFVGSLEPGLDATGLPNRVPLLRMYLPLFGLYAFMVRKEAAQAALDGAFPVNGQVDHALSQWLISSRGQAFRIAPRHCLFFSRKSEDGLDSDIQTMARLEELLENPERCERYLEFVGGGGASAVDAGDEYDVPQDPRPDWEWD